MPSYHEKREIAGNIGDVFSLVARVEDYPEFLPWCLSSRVLSRPDSGMIAELEIGSGRLRERFVSRVLLSFPSRIEITPHGRTPFRRLSSVWLFSPSAGGTHVAFSIDFEFRSPFLRLAFSPLFGRACERMVGAFEARAQELARKRRQRPPALLAAGPDTGADSRPPPQG